MYAHVLGRIRKQALLKQTPNPLKQSHHDVNLLTQTCIVESCKLATRMLRVARRTAQRGACLIKHVRLRGVSVQLINHQCQRLNRPHEIENTQGSNLPYRHRVCLRWVSKPMGTNGKAGAHEEDNKSTVCVYPASLLHNAKLYSGGSRNHSRQCPDDIWTIR